MRNTTPHTFDERLWALKSMQKHYNQVGLTSVIDRSEGAEGFRAYEFLHQRRELTVRTYVTWVVNLQGSPQQVRERIEAIPLLTGSFGWNIASKRGRRSITTPLHAQTSR